MEANTFKKPRPRPAGVALVMTLLTLSVLVILLVAFVSSMSLERQAAHANEETQRAKLVAQGAVSHAIDLLRTNIPEPADISEPSNTAPGENWAINPGRLTILKTGASPKYVALHTGEVTAAPAGGLPRDSESVDLNTPLPGETVPAITGTAAATGVNRPPMRVRWVNLLRDPSAAASATNRLVSRYAFWIDDECARVNFNTAVGKPAPAPLTQFGDQLRGGIVTPLFERGDKTMVMDAGGSNLWALGRPQSVNLDVLFDNSSQLLDNQLMAHTFLHGYARYPQAILDFVEVPSPGDWFDQHRYDLTFYSRSPEFNVFGKSRFFTTFVPLSLEAGPSYQHPFIYQKSNTFNDASMSSQVLNLNSLFGKFGYTDGVVDDDDDNALAGGAINAQQIDMLRGYLMRTWPGYSGSFATKFGGGTPGNEECYQIALNAVLMARIATTQIGSTLSAFSKDWSYRTTSVNYTPKSTEKVGETPERFYWVHPDTNKLMLPQMPGPYITEIRLFAKAVTASKIAVSAADDRSAPPKNDPTKLATYVQPVYIQYRYEVEYYMNPTGPIVDISEFPVRMDYLQFTATEPLVGGTNFVATQVFNNKNWNHKTTLARLATLPDPVTSTSTNSLLGPSGSTYVGPETSNKPVEALNRRVVSSPIFTLGQRPANTANPDLVPYISGADYTDWTPQPFEASKAKDDIVNLNLKFRAGMGVLGAAGRPRQMIPLGVADTDTLQAQFAVGIRPAGQEMAISWQINDPRLSWDLQQWVANRQGPGDSTATGTPGEFNRTENDDPIEPLEDASEKSKFRYIQRAPTGAYFGGYALDRGDEYDTAGRMASPGYWSLLHTGMQSRVPWRTLDLGPATGSNLPPDWLLLDLIGATYPMAHDQWKIDATLPDSFSTPSYMNSTAGQVNLNSRIYPQNEFFKAPERTKALTAVFKNLRTDDDVAALVDSINSYQSDTEVFDYVGELSSVPGALGTGTTQWDRELLLRNMAGCLTTKSNTFGVWGVAQVVNKLPSNQKHDAFERGDSVRAEKRFYALVERYIWPGRDGVPGNAHADANGKWDRIARQKANISVSEGITDTLFQLPGSPPLYRTSGPRLELDANATNPGTYPVFDGPQPVGMNTYAKAALGKISWTKTTLEEAYNPPQAAIKYRVVYFKYLDP